MILCHPTSKVTTPSIHDKWWRAEPRPSWPCWPAGPSSRPRRALLEDDSLHGGAAAATDLEKRVRTLELSGFFVDTAECVSYAGKGATNADEISECF